MRKILFVALSGRGWIGGLYYINNVLYTLDVDNRKDLDVTVIVSPDNAHIFKEFKNVRIVEHRDSYPLLNKIVNIFLIWFFKRNFNRGIAKLSKRLGIDSIYPAIHFPFLFNKSKSIGWIPDFQETHYPEWFGNIELYYRQMKAKYYANVMNKVVLSSKTAKKDFLSFSKTEGLNATVLPFISNIEKYLEAFEDDSYFNSVEEKHCLSKRYFVVCNQFWRHKNHKVVFEAIKRIYSVLDSHDVEVVFTGSKYDYRKTNITSSLLGKGKNESACFDKLMEMASHYNINRRIKYLGLIDRAEQLALIYRSIAVIQPSLFEGWGTVLEDAKVLDRWVILSDTDIHKEQGNEKAIFFDPKNDKQLALIMKSEIERNRSVGDFHLGLLNAKKRAKEYSREFIELIQ